MTPHALKDAAQQYSAAHATHYTAKNLRKAIESYNGVIISHPESAEAGYSRTQIMNIASSVLAKDLLLEAQMELALAELGSDEDSRAAGGAAGEKLTG